jgi:hypothetical protein
MKRRASKLDKHKEQIRQWLVEGVSKAEIGRRLGTPRRTIGHYVSTLMEFDSADLQTQTVPQPTSQGFHKRFSDDSGEATLSRGRVTTIDDLVEACDIDLDVWEIVSYQCKVWEMGRKAKAASLTFVDGVVSGKSEDSGGIYTKPMYSVAAKFQKRVEKTHEELVDHLREMLSDLPQREWRKPAVSDGADDTLELMLPDIHLGLLAYHDQTEAGDYNMEIAEKLIKAAVYGLVAQSGDNIKRIVMPIGNDYLNVDNIHGTTTKGTRQDEEAPYYKSFSRGWKILAEVIETLATRYEVDVPVIPGNHDTERSYYLGEVLAAWFRDNEFVTIDNAPTTRKYRLYGVTLIGYSHGDKEPSKDLPMLMAQQRPELWARSLFREWHQGHLHHLRGTEIQGVVIRTFPSISAPSAWGAGKGHVMATRQACAVEYTMQGPVRQYNWFVLTGSESGEL